MDLKTHIQDDMKTAMRSKDSVSLVTIRLLLAAIKQVEVDERRELSNEDIIGILTKMIKQRKDSVEIYSKANRQDMADVETAEIVLLSRYLPEALSAEDIQANIASAIAESGASSIKDMGKVMNILRPKLTGRADMGSVSAQIKEALNALS